MALHSALEIIKTEDQGLVVRKPDSAVHRIKVFLTVLNMLEK